jgi:hypothetical protein
VAGSLAQRGISLLTGEHIGRRRGEISRTDGLIIVSFENIVCSSSLSSLSTTHQTVFQFNHLESRCVSCVCVYVCHCQKPTAIYLAAAFRLSSSIMSSCDVRPGERANSCRFESCHYGRRGETASLITCFPTTTYCSSWSTVVDTTMYFVLPV